MPLQKNRYRLGALTTEPREILGEVGHFYQESQVVQWLERPTGIWEAMGSISVRDSVFFFVPRSPGHARDKWTFHLNYLFTELKIYHLDYLLST